MRLLRNLLLVLAALSLSATAYAGSFPPLVMNAGQIQQAQSGDTVKIPNITGSTQCVQADTSGNLTGTGSTCGGSGSGSLIYVGSASVAGSAATTLTISGLDLDTDGRYFIMLTLRNATTSAANISLYCNSDTTAGDYTRQALTANGSSITGTRASDAIVGGLDSNAGGTGAGNNNAILYLWKDFDGYPAMLVPLTWRGGTSGLLQTFAVQWKTTGTNVTSLIVSSSISSSLDVGSKIEVWKVTH